jgi:hypothetical protein
MSSLSLYAPSITAKTMRPTTRDRWSQERKIARLALAQDL